MGRTKKSNYHDVNASIGNKDFFGTIYDGMLKTESSKGEIVVDEKE